MNGVTVTEIMHTQDRKRLRIPWRTALLMLATHAWSRIRTQIRSVAFVVVYLVFFQVVVLGVPIANALSVSVGVALVIVGLAFFLEGLLLGLMPLGERVGIKIPLKGGLAATVGFGLLVGLGSTFAEPAVAALRTAGALVTAWDTPLLYILLEQRPDALFLAIGIGVGIAVALGMVRFYYGLSIKPFVVVLTPLTLGLSLAMTHHGNLASIVGLAWDTGAITTGAVTVPIVLAMGIGVSRAAGKSEMAGAGFGVIMLASLLPVLSVLLLGFAIGRNTPAPTCEATFFSNDYRAQALRIFEDEDALAAHAFRRGGETGRRALFDHEKAYQDRLSELVLNPQTRRRMLGVMSLRDWLARQASDAERAWIANLEAADEALRPQVPFFSILGSELFLALRAVIPLALLLLFTLLLYLRERPRYHDEVMLGIGLCVIGMMFLTSGIQLGLTPLGDDVGRHLSRVLESASGDQTAFVIENFDRHVVFEVIDTEGRRKPFFYLLTGDEPPRPVAFYEDQYDVSRGRYIHHVPAPARSRGGIERLFYLGSGLILLFAFGIGFGSTLAEPALNAMGHTVEEMTVGTVTQTALVRVVAVGVGLGLTAGMVRIIYDLPLLWLLAPAYLLLIPLTLASAEDFASIAWDSGGVTTGVVTVPLVLAMGLGVGRVFGVVDGFGVLALASVYPIVSVMCYGLIARYFERRSLRETEG